MDARVSSQQQTSGECISMTIRLAGICGYQAELGALSYATGAPAARKVAHKRIREAMNSEGNSNKALRCDRVSVKLPSVV